MSMKTMTGIISTVKWLTGMSTGRAAMYLLSLATCAGTVSAEVLFPGSLTSKIGANTSQSVVVLTTYDQTGSQDVSTGYIRFSSKDEPLRLVFTFNAPAGVIPQGLALDIDYKGPAKSGQTWRVERYDYGAGRWRAVGDNADAGNWLWTQMTFSVTGDVARFINHAGALKARYVSAKPGVGDASDIDYLAIRLDGEAEADSGTTSQTGGSTSDGRGSTSQSGGGASSGDTTSDVDGQPLSPPATGLTPGTSWQMQITGNVDTSHNAQIYDIDLFDASQAAIDALHTKGRTVICYFSAGSWEDWRPDAGAFPASVIGKSNGWPGEKWLNIADLNTLGPIMAARLDRAVQRGCDGVDPDNVDGYANNTGFNLRAVDQLVYNEFLATQAHLRGLLVGLKNDVDQARDLVDYFDFAVNEQCQEYSECTGLDPFIAHKKLVMQIEYSLAPAQFCPQAIAANRDAQKKTLDLDSRVLADCRKDY
jgi:hypothetical protein